MLKKIIRFPLIILTVLLALGLLVGSASAWVAPSVSMIPTYLGLAYPGIVLANILALLMWLLHFKKYVLIPIVAMAICHADVFRSFMFHSADKSENIGGKTLKVLSYNLFISNVDKKGMEHLKYVVNQDADIVCLQEFGYVTDKKRVTLDDAKGILDKKYPYSYLDLSKTDACHCGVVVLSKYKIMESKDFNIDSSFPGAAFVKLDVDGQLVRVACLHLQSNRLTAIDKAEIAALRKADKEERKTTIKHIEMKLSDAYVKREKQADLIAEELAKSDGPTIVCGDFNDVPVSYVTHTIRGKMLNDAFAEVGNGYCNTYHENNFLFRIDQMLYSEHFQPISYKVDTVSYSDHYPVVATFSLKK